MTIDPTHTMENEKELDELKKEVFCDIKSLLFASKEGLTEKELKSEYYKLVGRPIESHKFGYNSLKDMLENMSDSIETKIAMSNMGYLKIYFAKPDETTNDLLNLV